MKPKTRITLIIVAGAVAVALLVTALLSGAPIDVVAIVTPIVTAVIGYFTGREARPPFALLALIIVGASACAPCIAEQAVVSALDAGLEAADESVGDEGSEEWQQTLNIAQGVTRLGEAAVGGCELARDSAGWQSWVGLALETAIAVAAHFGGAGPGDVPATPPDELISAISVLQGEVEE